MKKTEKIEIRVSPEEKTALAQSAHASGRSISEWVRRVALDGRPPQAMEGGPRPGLLRPVLAAVGGLAAGAVATAGGMTVAFDLMATKPAVFSVEIALLDSGSDGRRAFETSSVITSGQPATRLRMPMDTGGAYRVDVAMRTRKDGSVHAMFEVCLETGELCTPVAKPALYTRRNEPTSVRFSDPAGRRLMIGIAPA